MAKLLMLAANEVALAIELNEDYMSIGRSEETDVCIQHSSLSKYHGMLVRDGDEYQIHDFASTNGTYVNGQRVMAARLKHGDHVRIGLVEFRYESTAARELTPMSAAVEPAAAATAAPPLSPTPALATKAFGTGSDTVQPPPPASAAEEQKVFIRLPAGATPPVPAPPQSPLPEPPQVPVPPISAPATTPPPATPAEGPLMGRPPKPAADRPLGLRPRAPGAAQIRLKTQPTPPPAK